MKDRTYYFLHIPKTAGTSFTGYFSKFFTEEEIFPGHFWYDIVKYSPMPWNKYRFYRGHFGYSLRRFLPQDAFTLTFLRDPVERVISQHHHALVDPYLVHTVANREYKSIENGDLKKMLQVESVRTHYWNAQARFVGIDIDILQNTTSEELESSSAIHHILSKHAGKMPESELLGNAVKHLKTLDFIGIQEYFEQSCLLLAFKTGLTPRVDNKREMTFSGRPQITDFDEETITELRKLNHLDYVLYEMGKQEFMREYTETISMLAQSLRREPPEFDDIDTARAIVRAHQLL